MKTTNKKEKSMSRTVNKTASAKQNKTAPPSIVVLVVIFILEPITNPLGKDITRGYSLGSLRKKHKTPLTLHLKSRFYNNCRAAWKLEQFQKLFV